MLSLEFRLWWVVHGPRAGAGAKSSRVHSGLRRVVAASYAGGEADPDTSFGAAWCDLDPSPGAAEAALAKASRCSEAGIVSERDTEPGA